jgi:shikimate dehydrogenase
VSDEAARIGAVNCLRLDGLGRASGYNTDFIGLIKTLKNKDASPRGRRVLVLGTGGAARAAAFGLLRAGAARVILAGRSIERARRAARSLGSEAGRLEEIGKMLREVEIVVSCLPFSATRILADPVPPTALVVDAHYSKPKAPPGEMSRRPSTALSWLFHQAIPSFEIFTARKVPEAVERRIWSTFSSSEPRPKPHLALVGFMGTGKTTVGQELARLTKRECVDTDEIVEAKAGMSVPSIFRREGESAFRSLEKEVLATLLEPGRTPKIISVGGGAVLDKDNRAALAQACRVVWLWASVQTALSRVDLPTRPVLATDRPLESAERTLSARLPVYAGCADLVLSSESRSALDIARRIKDEMGQTL